MNTLTREKPLAVAKLPSRRHSRLFRRLDRVMRRVLDLSVSLAGLFFLSPVFVFIALLIKSDSSGPVFYRGRRVGRAGKEFNILKFRTMYETPESHKGPKVTAKGDERITPVGDWLRRTKLNELPQFWNVLVGEMSLVGPRPEDPDIVKTWPEDARRELFSVKPGITSPASILYRDEESLLTAGNVMDDYLRTILPTKLRLDQLYVRNRSLFSDLDVVFWTLIILIPQVQHEKIPETRLYWGPLSVFMAHDFRWFVVDFLVAMGSVTTVGVIWRTFTPLHIGWQYAPLIALTIALATSLVNALRGLNRVYWAKASPVETLDILFSAVLAIALVWLVDRFLLTRIHVPVGLFILGGMVTSLGFVAVRYRKRILSGLVKRWLGMRLGGPVIGERTVMIPNLVAMMRDEFHKKPSNEQGDPASDVHTPARVEGWLRELENLMQAGDYAAVRMQIEHLRGGMLVEPRQ